MSENRITLNVRRDHADQIELMAKTAGQPKVAITDALLAYALERASIKHIITVEFSDKPQSSAASDGKPPSAPLTFTASGNGVAAEALQEEESEEDEADGDSKPNSHAYNKSFGKPDSSGLERRNRVLSIMRELGAETEKVTAFAIRTEYRKKHNEDTGNVNSLLDTCIKAGQVKKDTTELPYRFSLIDKAT